MINDLKMDKRFNKQYISGVKAPTGYKTWSGWGPATRMKKLNKIVSVAFVGMTYTSYVQAGESRLVAGAYATIDTFNPLLVSSYEAEEFGRSIGEAPLRNMDDKGFVIEVDGRRSHLFQNDNGGVWSALDRQRTVNELYDKDAGWSRNP